MDLIIIFIDKLKAILFAEIAVMKASFGSFAEADEYITDAYKLAKKFDAAPIYTTQGIKFLSDDATVGISLDGLGETAMDGIEGFVFGNAEPSEALEYVKSKFARMKND